MEPELVTGGGRVNPVNLQVRERDVLIVRFKINHTDNNENCIVQFSCTHTFVFLNNDSPKQTWFGLRKLFFVFLGVFLYFQFFKPPSSKAINLLQWTSTTLWASSPTNVIIPMALSA